MTFIAGCDPGVSGAIAVYCTDTKRLVSVVDIPNWGVTVGKKVRTRVDKLALRETFDVLKMMSVEMVVLEAVGGRPQQSATTGFVFGHTVGLIEMASIFSGIYVQSVAPKEWKKIMHVPGKKVKDQKNKTKEQISEERKKAIGDIMKAVQRFFPGQHDMFRTRKGGYSMDRADAAMIAKFGGDYVFPTFGLSHGADKNLFEETRVKT